MRESSEFYDVQISQEIISEKDKNNLTNMLMKTEETSNKQCDNDHHCDDNQRFYASVLLLLILSIASGIYVCFILGKL
jgi:hypothetical protein